MSFTGKQSIQSTCVKFLAGTVFLAALFLSHASAQAATLSISPLSGSYPIGKTISVRVLVGSGGQSINAVSGLVTFSSDTLTLTGISKSGIVTLWAQDPTYSNANGTASFQGVILNGYSGGSGTVLSLTFRAKAEGTATIGISGSGSSVLLNDGQGTNVLSSTSGATFSITRGTAPTPTQPVQPVEPTVPAVTPPVEAPKVAAPLFTDYQSPLSSGDFVVVKGTASPNSLVTVTFTHSLQNGTTTVSQTTVPVTETGTFAFISDEKVSEGSTYTLVATAADGQHTAPLSLAVKNSISFVLAAWIAAVLAIRVLAWPVLLLLVLITTYLLHRNHLLKKHLQMAIDKIHETEMK